MAARATLGCGARAPRFRIVAVVLVALGPTDAALAQAASEPYGRVTAAEGGAFVFLPSPAGRLAAERNLPVLSRSTLRTASGGRMEIDIAPQATLRLSENTEAELVRSSAMAWELVLRRGKVHLETWGEVHGGPSIGTEFGDVIPRLRAQVAVARAADGVIVDARDGVVEVRSGEEFATMLPAPGRIILRRGTPILSSAAPSGAPGRLRDDFMAWVERRQDERGAAGVPADLWGVYGSELSANGTFVRLDDTLCWTPAAASDPLREGWSLTVAGEEIWIARATWGWATSHYGSWLMRDGRWLWVPGQDFQSKPSRVVRMPAAGTPHPLSAPGEAPRRR